MARKQAISSFRKQKRNQIYTENCYIFDNIFQPTKLLIEYDNKYIFLNCSGTISFGQYSLHRLA